MKKIVLYCIYATLLTFSSCSSDSKIENLEHVKGQAVINTAAATELTETTATLTGSIESEGTTPLTEWGICFGSEGTPTERIKASGAKDKFSVQVNQLEGGRLYYFRAYAVNANGEVVYGNEKVFSTTSVVPAVKTLSAQPTNVDVALKGELVFNGGQDLTEAGFCYAKTPNPTAATGVVVELSGGTYEAAVKDLEPNTTYYVRFYAANVVGIGYGNELEFKTGDYPTADMPFSEDFSGEVVPPKMWSMLDHDEDGKCWYYYKVSSKFPAIASRSYENNEALNPYNFIITPRIRVSGSNPVVRWKTAAHSEDYYDEHYKVVVSEVPITNANCEDASVVKTLFEETLATDDWTFRQADLSAYVGKEVFIAWVHYNVSDVSRLYISDIKIINVSANELFSEYFSNGKAIFPPVGWSLLDKDGDGNSWEFYSFKSGKTAATSHSYKNSQELTPNNFLVTPLITASGSAPTLSWVVEANSSSYYQEYYKVVVSEVPISKENCEDASVVKTIHEEELPVEAGDDGVTRSLDLSAYIGKSVYIAWVHFNCTNMSRMYIYDIKVTKQP